MVDSRWTFTICGGLLLKRGLVKSVTPLAIADTSNQMNNIKFLSENDFATLLLCSDMACDKKN